MRSNRPPPPAPPPNTRFGKYTLLDRIAVGGMAEVFRAQEPRAAGEPRAVVVKRMLPHIAAEPDAERMFAEEARLGRILDHDNVVRVLDFGEEAGTPYLVLEYVRGVDLWRLTRWVTQRGERIGVDLALYLVERLLGGLHAVHEAVDEEGRHLGIVHRDVSPSNVLLSHHGEVKLADFGIAMSHLRERFPEAGLNTRTRGKLGYLPPEQVIGAPIDRRGDVFSAAVIAAELLMGRPLFAGGSELAVLLAIRDVKIHPFLEAMGALPTGLGETIVSALAADPESRVESADLFRQQLAGYRSGADDGLRRELATQVSGALAAAEGLSAVDRETVVGEEPATPARPPDRELIGETTGKLPELPYEIRTQSGQPLGRFSFAQVIELVATGRVGARDLVRFGGSEEKRIVDVPELAAHVPPLSLEETTREISEPAEPVERSDLKEGGFIGALGRLALRRDTGLLLCELGGLRKEVYVKDGAPEFVTSNFAGELLGAFLVSRGVIQRSELDMALAVMPRYEGRLGDTLVGLGLVEPVQLFQLIGEQVRAKLLDLFLWMGGQAAFYRGVPPPSRAFPLGLDVWKILEDGVGRRVARKLHDGELQASTWLMRVDPPPPDVAEAALPKELRRALERFDAARTVADVTAEIGRDAGKDDDHGKRAVLILLHIGAIRWL